MSKVTSSDVARYLQGYIVEYRREYALLTSPAPEGSGFPDIGDHPALDDAPLDCFVCRDGVVLSDASKEPPDGWHIAGGPAIMTDFPDTRTPPEITALLTRLNPHGDSIGIYRVVSESGIPDDVWQGKLPKPKRSKVHVIEGRKQLSVTEYDLPLLELVKRLTFGAVGLVLNTYVPDKRAALWQNQIIRSFGFLPADRRHRRFFRYLELIPHTDVSAWDKRSIWARCYIDVRREFAHQLANKDRPGGYFELRAQRPPPLFDQFRDRLAHFASVVAKFESLLAVQPPVPEEEVHKFLEENTAILDVYGSVDSKPRFDFPESGGPTGKSHIVPDFIVTYPNRSYQIVEIERPSKLLSTASGQPRSETTQAAYQLAEFKYYVQNYFSKLKDRYPGLSSACRYTLIIGRETEKNIINKPDPVGYLRMIAQTFSADDVLTYDDLLRRAREAYIRLSALSADAR